MQASRMSSAAYSSGRSTADQVADVPVIATTSHAEINATHVSYTLATHQICPALHPLSSSTKTTSPLEQHANSEKTQRLRCAESCWVNREMLQQTFTHFFVWMNRHLQALIDPQSWRSYQLVQLSYCDFSKNRFFKYARASNILAVLFQHVVHAFVYPNMKAA